MLLPQVEPRQDNRWEEKEIITIRPTSRNFSNNTFFLQCFNRNFCQYFSRILWLLVIDFRFLALDNKPRWNFT